MDFSITDYTIVSSWEQFSKDLEAAHISEVDLHHNGGYKKVIVKYKGYPLNLHIVSELPRNESIKGIDSFSIPTDNEQSKSYAFIGRVMGMERYIFIQSDEVTISASTARLIMSSFKQVLRVLTVPVLIEFQENDKIYLMGLCEKSVAEGVSKVYWGSTVEVYDSVDRSIKTQCIASEVASERIINCSMCLSISLSLSSLNTSHSQSAHSLPSLKWGMQNSRITSLLLEAIFPKVDYSRLRSGFLPLPTDAPIWLVSVKQCMTEVRPGDCLLSKLILMIVQVLREAQLPPDTTRPTLHCKTQISSFYHTDRSTDGPESILINRALEAHSESDTDCALNIAKLLLWAYQSTGELNGKFTQIWFTFISKLRQSWSNLERVNFKECSAGSDGIVEEYLKSLNDCIEREINYSAIPNIPERRSEYSSIQATTLLDSLAQQRQQQQQRRKFDKLNAITSKLKQVIKRSHHTDNTSTDNTCAENTEEYFDAVEDEIYTIEDAELLSAIKQLSIEQRSDGEVVAEGRREIFKGDIYIPFTQEPDTRHTSHHPEHHKTRTGDQLISDMQAFKAANPKCTFIDFVSWYSPKDILPDGVSLSVRMSTPHNLWIELWNACGPLPVNKQQLLFDHRREAEGIFTQLECLSIVDLFDWLLQQGLVIAKNTIEQVEGCKLILNIPSVIDGDSLEAFTASLYSAEYHLSLLEEIKMIFPDNVMDIDSDYLLQGHSQLIGTEQGRDFIKHLLQQGEYSQDTEVIIESDTRRLYICHLSDLLSIYQVKNRNV